MSVDTREEARFANSRALPIWRITLLQHVTLLPAVISIIIAHYHEH